jgi:D-hydroxyproline dehydrogenase subunit beta
VSQVCDAVIAGAGIVGTACADALSREGLRVAVVEPGVVGGGATAAGMGHLVVLDDSDAQFALSKYSRDLWDALSPALPAEVEFERRGTLWVAADEEELAAARAKRETYCSRGVSAEMLDGPAVAEAEPNLRPGLAGGLLVESDSVLYAPCAARWLLDRALERKASLYPGVGVTAFTSEGVLLSDGSRISAGAAICANGTWATELFPTLAVRPRKGHLAITDRYPGFLHHQLVELGYLKSAHGDASESVAFNVQPRRTGQVLIGSSRQYGATDTGTDHGILSRMLRRAIDYMPALGNLSVIRCWTGFRAATEDKLPIIGPCPGRETLYLATGHEGLGITTSLGTAQLVADLMMGRAPSIDPAPYSASRLGLEWAHG